MDFTDRITLGGGFDVNWDSSLFAFKSYVSAGLGDHIFGGEPVLQDGRLFNGGVGRFNGLTRGLIASLSFTLIGQATANTNSITPSGTLGENGPWSDGVTFVDIIEPDYFGASVAVPAPAAVWCLLSGLSLLMGVGRRNIR